MGAENFHSLYLVMVEAYTGETKQTVQRECTELWQQIKKGERVFSTDIARLQALAGKKKGLARPCKVLGQGNSANTLEGPHGSSRAQVVDVSSVSKPLTGSKYEGAEAVEITVEATATEKVAATEEVPVKK